MTRLAEDLPLFNAVRGAPAASKGPSPVERALEAIDADALTPRDALEAIYSLKEQLKTDD